MKQQEEMIKVDSWILYLSKYDIDEPVFYYNPVTDSFDRKFSTECSFWSEEACIKKENELNLDGIYSAKGTIDVPKEFLIDTIMSVAVDLGFVNDKPQHRSTKISLLELFKYYQELESVMTENRKENLIDYKINQQYNDLHVHLNAGNIRHVVYMLYTEEGLTAEEFGQKIGYSEKEITDFTKKGGASNCLMESICEYFGISMTSQINKYILT